MRFELITQVASLRVACVVFLCACSAQRPFPPRSPLWHDDDMRPFSPRPEEYYSPFAWDGADQMMFRPMARFFAVDPAGEAINVNAFDEVPNSSFFQNRIGIHDMTPSAFARGSCGGTEPLDPLGPWTVTGAKPNGAHPGFMIKDPSGRRFLLKFDGHAQPERASSADVIGSILYHAAGYYAPCNKIVFFSREVLRIDKASIGKTDIERVLSKGWRTPDGRYRAIASLFVPGKPLGPFRYEGTRDDDPNDAIDHQDRRELRGAYALAAWINHFDAREQNTLDVWIDTGQGRGYVRHYMLDFGDCFGSQWNWDGITRRLGPSGYFKLDHIARDFVTFGIAERSWERARFGPAGATFGYYGTFDDFNPDAWFPGYPNPAFTRRSERDAAWMARIIARISREHLQAAIAEAEFSQQLYASELLRILEGRRARILKRFLSLVSPLTAPEIEDSTLCLQDLATYAGVVNVGARAYTAAVFAQDRAAPLKTSVRYDHRVCVEVPRTHSASRHDPAYLIIDIQGRVRGRSAAEGPARVHLYDFGDRYLLVGLERPEDAAPP